MTFITSLLFDYFNIKYSIYHFLYSQVILATFWLLSLWKAHRMICESEPYRFQLVGIEEVLLYSLCNLHNLITGEFSFDKDTTSPFSPLMRRSNITDWNHIYEKLTDMIVPRSSQLVTQDNDYALFTVTLFKKVVDEFKHHAREKK